MGREAAVEVSASDCLVVYESVSGGGRGGRGGRKGGG